MQADLADIAHWKFCIGMVEMWDSHEECFGEPTLLAGHAQDGHSLLNNALPQKELGLLGLGMHRLCEAFF